MKEAETEPNLNYLPVTKYKDYGLMAYWSSHQGDSDLAEVSVVVTLVWGICTKLLE